MSELTAADFGPFFTAVHGTAPFQWQQRLAEEVINGGAWPEVIDLPTGAGKTAALDVAVFSLALDPHRFPRRIVFVIDRRIVVDQVVSRGLRLCSALRDPWEPIVGEVASRLRSLSESGRPLGIVGLRGGVRLDHEWAHRPDQPWIIATTVDQFGSRVLFRGYGTTPRMRPVHAGLAGSDCLVLLDEVQISRPFAETLGALRDTPSPLPRRWQFVQMSATPGDEMARRFTLQPEDLDPESSPELSRRILARKTGRLVTVGKTKGARDEVLARAARSELARLPDTARVVGIVLNRVSTARRVAAEIGPPETTHLLTGRMRPLDRVDAVAAIAAVVDPERDRTPVDRHVIVATQSIEVGADFDFDALVTECAPVDSLRQRFGRLDRRGNALERLGQAAQAVILGGAFIEKQDPVYGAALHATWSELTNRFGTGEFDVGPLTLSDLPAETHAPALHAPILLPTHLDAWCQSQPVPDADPPITPFLHGIGSEHPAEVSVIWRGDISFIDPWGLDSLVLVPPRSSEMMSLPIDAVRRWLNGEAEPVVTDIEGGIESPSEPTGEAQLPVLRWQGADSLGPDAVIEPRNIRPGDILIVPSTYGGISQGNWDPSSKAPVTDLGDRAQIATGPNLTLRLHPQVIDTDSLGLPPLPRAGDETSEGSDRDLINSWLEDVARATEGRQTWLAEVATKLRSGGRYVINVRGPADDPYFVLSKRLPAPVTSAGTETDPFDASDTTNSLTGSGTLLEDHLHGVGTTARLMAKSLGLPDDVAADLELAGRLHDLGKLDDRFQLRLHGYDEVLWARSAEPLAKSHPSATRDRSRPRTYPERMRHELLSVALAESSPSALDGANDRDLVLHLIGTHHGYGRPLPPVLFDADPRFVEYDIDGAHLAASTQLYGTSFAIEWADRFWRLTQRYGHHGLAWLESILRLADHRRSEAEGRGTLA